MKKEIVYAKNEGSKISYPALIRHNKKPLSLRYLIRFDFTDEWNNLGYGRITKGPSPFSISTLNVDSSKFCEVISEVIDGETNKFICPFIAICEMDGKATLWINREKGVKDGIDYAIVEDFLLNYKTEQFGSYPILSEIPFGFKSAVTMRIDCDENIASGQKLAELYTSKEVPFSLAIKTSLEFSPENTNTINYVLENDGSVVGHSHTHAPNWGGSREQAKWEAETARERLKTILPEDYSFDWVVSPFHQNPQYAVKGLCDAGIKGFVSGIIKNDPEYLQSRAGYVSTGEPIITHSQQCMLHGDCYHDTGLDIYKQSFYNHYHSNTFFGYLDHPFSDYTYGWDNEKERLKAHSDFIDYMKSFPNVWFANLVDAMNFLWVKANTKVWIADNELKWNVPEHNYQVPNMKVFWNNKEYEIPSQS